MFNPLYTGVANNSLFTTPSTVTVVPAGDYEYEYGLTIQGPDTSEYAITVNGTPDINLSDYAINMVSNDALMIVGQGIRSLPAGANITLRNTGANSDNLVNIGLANVAYLILKRVGP